MIGERIRQKRIMNGLSLQNLADELVKKGRTLTRAMLSKYELGQATPNALVLKDLAEVLGVKTDYFFVDPNVSIQWKAFRKRASVSQTKQERIQILAEQRVEQFVAIETACGIESVACDLPEYRNISDVSQAETIADELRMKWRLDAFPIKSLTELLENKGIILVSLDPDIDGVDGLVGSLQNTRKIIVYVQEKSVDRTRLTLAHELGHLLLGNDDPKLNEKLASRFAGAFLAPAKLLRQDMGSRRTSFSIPELCLLKEKYGLSIQALTYRAKDIGILSESAYKAMFINFRSKGISVVEPGCWAYPEEPRLTKQYLFRAVAEGRIPEAKALEMYPEYLKEKTEMESQAQSTLYKFLSLSSEDRNKYLMAAAESAAGLYEDRGLLADFDAVDDVENYD